MITAGYNVRVLFAQIAGANLIAPAFFFDRSEILNHIKPFAALIV